MISEGIVDGGYCFFCAHVCTRLDFCMKCNKFVCWRCDGNFPSSIPPGDAHEVFDHISDPILRESLREKLGWTGKTPRR